MSEQQQQFEDRVKEAADRALTCLLECLSAAKTQDRIKAADSILALLPRGQRMDLPTQIVNVLLEMNERPAAIEIQTMEVVEDKTREVVCLPTT